MKQTYLQTLKKGILVLFLSVHIMVQSAAVVSAQEVATTSAETTPVETSTTSSVESTNEGTGTQSTTSTVESQPSPTPSDTLSSTETTGTTSISPTPTPTPRLYPVEEGDVNRTTSATSAYTLGTDPEPVSTTTTGGEVGDTAIETGDANASGAIVNDANTNLSESTGSTSGSGATVVNSGNGSDSTNSGSASIINDDTTTQNNSANIDNNLNADSTTGSNTSSKNVGNTSITTGDANTSGTVVNTVNTNTDGIMVSEFNIADAHNGDYVLDFFANCILGCSGDSLTAANTGNGSGSANTADIDSENSDYTFQNNDANIGNDLILSADSGYNDASMNTGGDTSITTGDANVSANSLTFANNNIDGQVVYGVVNIYGDLNGDIIFPEDQFNMLNTGATASNTGNGSGSTNTTDLTLANESNTFQFNDANIENNLTFDANTGGNQASGNTGGNTSVETGDVNVDANVLNIANTNLAGGNWWIVLVNEAGNWIGKIMGAPEGANFAGTTGMGFTVDENGYITATNSGNGSESTNTATASQSNTDTTVQNNTANIQNNLNLSANTGYNTANNNTGGDTSITTGDANIMANLVNFVNNNITGNGKLFVTVVNVFGSWTGNFFGPGQKKEVPAQETAKEENKSTTEQKTENKTVTENKESVQGTQTATQSTTDTNEERKVAGAHAENTQTTGTTGMVMGASDTIAYSNEVQEDSLMVRGVGNTGNYRPSATEKLTINLAWAVLAIPVLGLGLIARKKLFKSA